MNATLLDNMTSYETEVDGKMLLSFRSTVEKPALRIQFQQGDRVITVRFSREETSRLSNFLTARKAL